MRHNIEEAVNKSLSVSNKFDTLCYLQSSIDTSHVRVIVLGGSVTFGQDAHLCCEREECQKLRTRCAWVGHFGAFLNTITNGQVKTFNLGDTFKWSCSNSVLNIILCLSQGVEAPTRK